MKFLFRRLAALLPLLGCSPLLVDCSAQGASRAAHKDGDCESACCTEGCRNSFAKLGEVVADVDRAYLGIAKGSAMDLANFGRSTTPNVDFWNDEECSRMRWALGGAVLEHEHGLTQLAPGKPFKLPCAADQQQDCDPQQRWGSRYEFVGCEGNQLQNLINQNRAVEAPLASDRKRCADFLLDASAAVNFQFLLYHGHQFVYANRANRLSNNTLYGAAVFSSKMPLKERLVLSVKPRWVGKADAGSLVQALPMGRSQFANWPANENTYRRLFRAPEAFANLNELSDAYLQDRVDKALIPVNGTTALASLGLALVPVLSKPAGDVAVATGAAATASAAALFLGGLGLAYDVLDTILVVTDLRNQVNVWFKTPEERARARLAFQILDVIGAGLAIATLSPNPRQARAWLSAALGFAAEVFSVAMLRKVASFAGEQGRQLRRAFGAVFRALQVMVANLAASSLPPREKVLWLLEALQGVTLHGVRMLIVRGDAVARRTLEEVHALLLALRQVRRRVAGADTLGDEAARRAESLRTSGRRPSSHASNPRSTRPVGAAATPSAASGAAAANAAAANAGSSAEATASAASAASSATGGAVQNGGSPPDGVFSVAELDQFLRGNRNYLRRREDLLQRIDALYAGGSGDLAQHQDEVSTLLAELAAQRTRETGTFRIHSGKDPKFGGPFCMVGPINAALMLAGGVPGQACAPIATEIRDAVFHPGTEVTAATFGPGSLDFANLGDPFARGAFNSDRFAKLRSRFFELFGARFRGEHLSLLEMQKRSKQLSPGTIVYVSVEGELVTRLSVGVVMPDGSLQLQVPGVGAERLSFAPLETWSRRVLSTFELPPRAKQTLADIKYSLAVFDGQVDFPSGAAQRSASRHAG